MSYSDSLYTKLKPDVQALAGPLFDLSDRLVRKRGAFLPHAAVLDTSGDVRLLTAAPPGLENRAVSSVEVLPALHDALRATACAEDLRAIAVCEDVTITPHGGKKTAAIKVLVEHQGGLCVALYLPFHRKGVGGYEFGQIFATPANPEVRIWEDGETT